MRRWHFAFNWPAFIIVMLLTVILVPRHQESARTNNIMVLLKIIAILVFGGFRGQVHPSRTYHPSRPMAGPNPDGRVNRFFFTYIGSLFSLHGR